MKEILKISLLVVAGCVLLVIILIGSCTVRYQVQDDTAIESPLVGKIVEVPPNAGMAKMQGWNGWADRYLHLKIGGELVNLQSAKVQSFQRFNEFTKLKLIEVRRKNYDVGSSYHICLFKKIDGPSEVVTLRCEDIEVVEEYTELIRKILARLEKEKQLKLKLNHRWSSEFSIINVTDKNQLWNEIDKHGNGFSPSDLNFTD